MSDPLHQTLMCTLKGKTFAYIVNVIPIMSERGVTFSTKDRDNNHENWIGYEENPIPTISFFFFQLREVVKSRSRRKSQLS